MAATISSRPISTSTAGLKDTNYDAELHQPAAIERSGQRQWLNLRAMFSTSAENETKRAMQSRHLMMIGESPSPHHSPVHCYSGRL